MNIGIIDCGGANLNSIYYSFKRININASISDSPSELEKMDAYILPGVGSAGIVMNKLKEKNLINLIKETKKPTLGICIGMQILFDYSEEDNTHCLGLIKGDVKKFQSNSILKSLRWAGIKLFQTKIVLMDIIILLIAITQIIMITQLVIVTMVKNLIQSSRRITFLDASFILKNHQISVKNL